MRVDLSKWEMLNVVRTRRGLRTRLGLQSVKTPSASASFVGGFTVEAPSTTEPWHYIFERSAVGLVTMRVFTEEFSELFSYPLGPMARDPVITWGVQSNQIMVNSPSFSTCLYGVVGGGVFAALKQASEIDDLTTLDIPNGHIATFGDRFVIAQGPVIFPNDVGIDPRVFPGLYATSLPGSIYDIFQADNGLLMFTSDGLFRMSADALGTGSDPRGFITKIPGILTARPRNACVSNGRVYVLQADGVQIMNGPFVDVSPYTGRRFFGPAIDRADLRLVGEIHATPDGALVAFRGRRGIFCEIDRDGLVSWTTASTNLNVVGVLRGRTNEKLIMLSNRIVMPLGNVDFTGSEVAGIISGKIDVDEDTRPLVRRLTTSSANIGQVVAVAVDGTNHETPTTPTKTTDTIIGTSTWSTTEKLRTRQMRTVFHRTFEQASDPSVQVVVEGGDRALEPFIDVQMKENGSKISDGGA